MCFSYYVYGNYAYPGISMKLWVHTAILSIKTVCWAHEFQVPEESCNIRPWSYIWHFSPYTRPWSYKRVVLCSGKTGICYYKLSKWFRINDSELIHCFFRWWQLPYYYMGIKCYDLVAGRQLLKPSYILSKSKALELFPMLKKEKLVGALVYYDGKDARKNSFKMRYMLEMLYSIL